MLTATLKSLLARKVRLILSALAVVLGVMFVSGAFVLTDTLSRSFDAVFADAYHSVDVNVAATPKINDQTDSPQVSPPLPAALLDQIRTVPGVAEATGIVAADGARLIGSNGKAVTSFGPPQLGENWTGENDLVRIRQGRPPHSDQEIVINAALAKAAKVTIGDRVGVLTLAPKQEFTLVGIFEYSGGRDSIGGANEVAFTTPIAQQLMLGEPDTFTSITITAAEGVAAETLRDDVARKLGTGYEIKTGRQLSADSSASLKKGLSFFNKILLGFAAVALLVGTFLILNTFSIIVAQRTRELALLKAIGASGKQIIGSVVIEALTVGLLASILGLAAGIGVGALLAYLFGRFAGGLALSGIGVPPTAVISAFTVGLLITVLAALLPALRAARVPPIAAMTDIATPDRPLTRITVSGAVITAIGAALLALGLTDNAGANALAAILAGVLLSFIGVALLTPLISRPVAAALGAVFSWSVPGKLGRLNAGRNPRRTAITAAALMVGIALVTGVTVILESAKSSITAQAEQTIDAQLVISGTPTGPRPPTFDPAVVGQVAALPGVAVTAGIYTDTGLIDGQRQRLTAATDLSAVARIYHATARSGTLDTLKPDQAAISEPAAAELGKSVGDQITAQLPRGNQHTYTITAVVPENRLPGSILLPAQAATEFSTPQPNLALIQLTPGTPAQQVQPRVEALLADSPEVSVADRSRFIDQQTSQFDTILTMIQILLALAIVIAVLGIINTLALSVLERTRELGLLRAIGLRRGQTMRMITVEAVVISVFGALLGLAVGATLGAAVVKALNNEGITDLVLPWPRMGVLLALAAGIGVIAAVLPAARAARTNILGAIAHE